jgi:phosphate starvation-inducible protein PhoH and related proteins
MSRKNKKTKDTSVKVPQKDKIKDSITIFERDDLTDKQKSFIELVMDRDTKIVFVNGPAGTSKTFLSVYCGLHLLNEKKVSDLMYFRTIIESGKSLGSLPGELNDKFAPFMGPLLDKLEELTPKCDIQRLTKEERVVAKPINYLRGASFNVKFLLADEAQNFTFEELTTLVTRYGKFSKMIVCGDTRQSDIGNRSGFGAFYDMFNKEHHKQAGIHTFEFDKSDIVRSELLKLICETIENAKAERAT